MTNETNVERMFFTFRSNESNTEHELVEGTVERLDEHEPQVGEAAQKRSWFGTAEDLPAMLVGLGFSEGDVKGIVSTLKVNKVATREVASSFDALSQVGFTVVV